MTANIIFILIFFGLITILGVYLGKFMAQVFSGEKNILTPLLNPVEKFIYRICLIDLLEEMNWKKYALSFTLFNAAGLIFLFVLLLIQGRLPLNPQKFGPLSIDLAFNTAVSFMTNTDWQAYSGEYTMSYLSQMIGLTVQNFVSAGVGLAAAVAMIRGFTRKSAQSIGNFWVDLTRSQLYIMLPLSIIFAIVLLSQGVMQNLSHYINAVNLEGNKQVIAMGPVASQEAIKMLGSNGGGFFNANSAHPYENPTWLTNFIENIAMLLIPVAIPFMLGYMLKSKRKGVAIFAAMLIILLMGLIFSTYYEYRGNPRFEKLGITNGENMEGKETRFGIFESVFWAVNTTAIANGSVNSMHDSLLPLTAIPLLFNMLIGEVVFGGVGVGLMGMLYYAFMSMFIAGLMIGRTPEIYNKKLGIFEMVLTILGLITAPFSALIFTAVACSIPAGLSSLNNGGPHGFSEILYAYASYHGNNGSAFAGLNANTPFWNYTGAVAMLIGRFTTVIPGLAIAGVLAKKKHVPESASTFSTSSLLFVILLVGVVLIFGGLTFFTPFVLGPVLDHIFMKAGTLY